MRPEASVVTSCFRPGGVDVLLAGMHDQTFKNFEVIMVDHRYEKRHKKVMEFAKNYGVKMIHVPEYKRNGKWSVLAAAWNTGFMLAEAPVVIMLVDFAYAPPHWIETHLKHHYDKGRLLKKLVMSPHCHLALPPLRVKKPIDDINAWVNKQQQKRYCCLVQEDFGDYFDEISIFHSLFEPEWIEQLRMGQLPDQDPKLHTTFPLDYKWMHMKNESFSLESVLEVNGIDESFDQGKGPMDTEFGFRLYKSGCEVEFDRFNSVFVLNPRWIMGAMPWGDMDVSLEGRWSFNNHGIPYQNRRIQEIADGALPRAPNSYALRKKRKELLYWKTLDIVPTGNLESVSMK